jgi:hypothetical protein
MGGKVYREKEQKIRDFARSCGNDPEIIEHLDSVILRKESSDIDHVIASKYEDGFFVFPYKKSGDNFIWTDNKIYFKNRDQIKEFCRMIGCTMVED